MKAFILNSYYVSENWDPMSIKSSDFRKATVNMRYCFQAFNELFSPFEQLIKNYSIDKMGVFIGTSHGELEPTIEFIKNLEPSKVANPIHFQNSLHNSLLGFITQKFGLTSPGITISNSYFSAESAIEIALCSLQNKQIDFAVVLACDGVPQNCKELFLSLYQDTVIPTKIKSGASALLLCSKEALSSLNGQLQPIAALHSLECHYTKNHELQEPLNPYYDSDALEKISIYLQTNITSDQHENKLILVKPDQTYSSLVLETL